MRISDWSSDVCSSDLGGGQQVADALELGPGTLALARRETGDHDRARKFPAIGDAHAALVDLHAAAAAGGEQLVAKRVEDHRVDRLGAFAQRDRDAPVGEAAQVVAGAVERIDDPGMAAGAAVALLRAAFLAEDGVVGVGPARPLV